MRRELAFRSHVVGGSLPMKVLVGAAWVLDARPTCVHALQPGPAQHNGGAPEDRFSTTAPTSPSLGGSNPESPATVEYALVNGQPSWDGRLCG